MGDDGDIKQMLGEIKGKLDMSLENQRNMFLKVDGLEERMRELESHRSYILGVIAAASLVWVVVVEWVKGKINFS